MTNNVLSVNSEDFDEVVLNSDVPVIVDIWAEWCGPCRMLAPFFEKFAGQYAGAVKFVKVNKDDNEDIAEKYGVDSIPRLIVFNGGETVTEQRGMPDYPDLRNWIEEQVIAAGIAIEDSPQGLAAEMAFEASVSDAFGAYRRAVEPAANVMGKTIKPLQDEFAGFKKQLEKDEVTGQELADKLQEKGTELNERAAPAIAEYKKVSEPAEAILIASLEQAVDAFVDGATSISANDGGDGASPFGSACPIDDPNCQS